MLEKNNDGFYVVKPIAGRIVNISEMGLNEVFSMCMGLPISTYSKKVNSEPANIDFVKFSEKLKNTKLEKYINQLYEYCRVTNILIESQIIYSNELKQNIQFIKEEIEILEILKKLITKKPESEIELSVKWYNYTYKSSKKYWEKILINSLKEEVIKLKLNKPMLFKDAVKEISELKDIDYLKENGFYETALKNNLNFKNSKHRIFIEKYSKTHKANYDIDLDFIDEKLTEINENNKELSLLQRKGARSKNKIRGQIALRAAYLAALDDFLIDEESEDINSFTLTNSVFDAVLKFMEVSNLLQDYLNSDNDNQIHYINKLIKDAKEKNNVQGTTNIFSKTSKIVRYINNYKMFIQNKSDIDIVLIDLDYQLFKEIVSSK